MISLYTFKIEVRTPEDLTDDEAELLVSKVDGEIENVQEYLMTCIERIDRSLEVLRHE